MPPSSAPGSRLVVTTLGRRSCAVEAVCLPCYSPGSGVRFVVSALPSLQHGPFCPGRRDGGHTIDAGRAVDKGRGNAIGQAIPAGSRQSEFALLSLSPPVLGKVVPKKRVHFPSTPVEHLSFGEAQPLARLTSTMTGQALLRLIPLLSCHSSLLSRRWPLCCLLCLCPSEDARRPRGRVLRRTREASSSV